MWCGWLQGRTSWVSGVLRGDVLSSPLASLGGLLLVSSLSRSLSLTHTHTHTHTHTLTHTHTYTHIRTRTRMHTHTSFRLVNLCGLLLVSSLSHTLSLTHTHSQTRTERDTHTHTHAHKHTRTHTTHRNTLRKKSAHTQNKSDVTAKSA